MSLCQDVLICCPSKLPTKDVFAQKKVPRPVSRDGSVEDLGERGESPEGPRTPASFTDCGGASPGIASPMPASRVLPKNERKRLGMQQPPGARTPGGASTSSVSQLGACTPDGVAATPSRAPKASDLAKREPPKDAEPMNDHDYDGLLAVRLGLMGRALGAGAAAPTGELGHASQAVLAVEAAAPTISALTADLGALSREGSERCGSPDLRAQLLGSVRSELIRGLAAPRQVANGGEDVRSEHSVPKM